MLFHHRARRSPLDAFVASIWVFRDHSRPHGLERILPTGAAQLIVNLKEDRTRLYETDPPYRCVSTCGTILAGVQSRYQIIDTSEQEYVAGVAFKPGGSTAFVRVPAHETRDVDTPLEMLWGRQSTANLRELLLERNDPDAQLDAIENALEERLRAGARHPAIDFALAAFARVPLTANVGAVTNAVGMSAKALHRAIHNGGGPDTKALLPDSALSTRPRSRVSRRARRLGAGGCGLRTTGIRRTSFTSSGCFRDSRRPAIRLRGPHFRTTSNSYNPMTRSL